ncbi:MAG: hypothetical protein H8M99_16025 [Gloeobacteraceae cyanobacterium ES-bin-144]|nr:hypothetical protein [Verrucomicrobiales bacterium]
MKPNLLIPPLAALILSAIWIVSQQHSISQLDHENSILEKALADHASSQDTDLSNGKAAASSKPTKTKDSMDWKKIAAQMAEMQSAGGMGDMRSMIKLHQRLQEMSKEELIAALDEIAALDLPTQAKEQLEMMLLGPLIEKDPEFALTKFMDRIGNEQSAWGWQLASAFSEWAKKDSGKAIAWFDQQIAAGKFDSKSLDGKSRFRTQFEGSLMGALIGSDPAAAATRLSAMPEDQRTDVLRSFHQLKEQDQLAFAKLVRSQVPEKEQAKLIGTKAAQFVYKGGYPKVSETLDRIEATPAERTATAKEAANYQIGNLGNKKTITHEDIDAMREWVSTQAPESVDSITGNALARSLQSQHKTEFADVAALALQYHEASGNDEVLVAFLDNYQVRQNKEQALLLVEKITDEKSRERILKRIK